MFVVKTNKEDEPYPKEPFQSRLRLCGDFSRRHSFASVAFTARYRSFLAETALVTVYPLALKSSASFSALCTAFSNGIGFKCL